MADRSGLENRSRLLGLWVRILPLPPKQASPVKLVAMVRFHTGVSNQYIRMITLELVSYLVLWSNGYDAALSMQRRGFDSLLDRKQSAYRN